MKTLCLLLSFLLFLSNSALSADGEFVVIKNLETAIKHSEETGTKLLLVYTADWCKYCKSLEKDLTLNMSKVNQKYTVCFVDFDSNKELAAKHGVSSIPVSVIINDNIKKTGYNGDFNSYRKFLGL